MFILAHNIDDCQCTRRTDSRRCACPPRARCGVLVVHEHHGLRQMNIDEVNVDHCRCGWSGDHVACACAGRVCARSHFVLVDVGVENTARSGYANFAIAEPPLKVVCEIEVPPARRGVHGALNRLGVEVETTGDVAAGLLPGSRTHHNLRRDRHDVLLRAAGQSCLSTRPGGGAVGGNLHGSRTTTTTRPLNGPYAGRRWRVLQPGGRGAA